MNVLKLIGRKAEIFESDLLSKESELLKIVGESSFLVIGGAGSIGKAVTKEIFNLLTENRVLNTRHINLYL